MAASVSRRINRLCIKFKNRALFATTLFIQLYVRVGILLTRGKHFYDRIFLFKWEMWAHRYSLTLALLILVHVPCQESGRSCICVLGVRGHVFVC